MTEALITEARRIFHSRMIDTDILTVSNNGTVSNADSSSTLSKAIAFRTAEIISMGCNRKIHNTSKISGQTLGRQFEVLVSEFLQNTFLKLDKICPGKWIIVRGARISDFSQYAHLAALNSLIHENIQLAAILGNDYVITPDIVIYRERYDDDEINIHENIVNNAAALASDIRKFSGISPVMHASISAKFTMRSDRAQNSRTEALNLIRSRKGRLPHIVVVTAEPMPGRIASIALGTGDIDCVYHFALYELAQAVHECSSDDSIELLHALIDGKRLKDISDLPLDLIL